MAVAKRVITIPADLDPVAALGPADAVLEEVEKAFPAVDILVRGNRIELKAYSARDDAQADQAASVLEDIVSAAYKAPVQADSVKRTLERESVGRGHGHRLRSDAVPRHTSRVFGGTASDSRPTRHHKPFRNTDSHRMASSMALDEDTGHSEAMDRGDESQTMARHRSRVPGVITMAAGEPVRPKTGGQVAYVGAIESHTITFAIGPAGTGKTYLAVAKAVRAFEEGSVRRIVLTRPAVEAGENLGFLPGTLNDKVDPYLRPLYDALSDMLGAVQLHRYMADGSIEVAPLAYMRGRTLNDAFVILDEAQNTTEQQMKMFLTRLGFNTKMVITGDVTQVDLTVRHSGLATIERILGGIKDIAFAHLGAQDVVRHELVGRIVAAYDAYDARSVDRPDRKGRRN